MVSHIRGYMTGFSKSQDADLQEILGPKGVGA